MSRDSARLLIAVLAASLMAASCGSGGATASPVGAVEEVCIVDFCATYPADWVVAETGDRFVAFTHPDAEELIATVGRVNLEGIATNAGAAWPVPARDVVDLLWSLLDGGDAELGGVELVAGGYYDSWGFISTGRLWHRLLPVSASRGFGVEVRAPNASWEPHADTFRQGLVVLVHDL